MGNGKSLVLSGEHVFFLGKGKCFFTKELFFISIYQEDVISLIANVQVPLAIIICSSSNTSADQNWMFLPIFFGMAMTRKVPYLALSKCCT